MALFLSIAYFVVAATPALANHTANCSDSDIINRHSGQARAEVGSDGIAANIERQVLSQCTMPNFPVELSGSFAFVNVTGPATAEPNNIVQIGVGDCRSPFQCSGGMHMYSGWGRYHTAPGCAGFSDVSPTVQELAGGWPANLTYKVQHISNEWRLYGGNVLRQTVPEASICWTSDEVSWFGESWDKGDAIGGASSNKLRILEMQFSLTEGGPFFHTNLPTSNPCSFGAQAPYFCDITQGDAINLWTAR